jgi:nucleoside-diphosphate-sugar epimerase
MKILVTGSTGFIGSHLLYHLLLHNNIEVKALKRSSSSMARIKNTFNFYSSDGNASGALKKVEWIDGDLFNASSLYQATKDVDFVIHTAGMVSVTGADRDKMFQINKEGTKNLVLAAIRNQVKKFCYVSSTSVFNRNNASKSLKNPYAISKLSADNIVRKCNLFGMQPLIVYPSVVIGAGNGESGFEKILNSIWYGNLFYTSGGAEFVDVRDVVKAIINLMMSNLANKGFVVSSGYLPYKQVLEIAATALHKTKPFIPLGYNIAKFQRS